MSKVAAAGAAALVALALLVPPARAEVAAIEASTSGGSRDTPTGSPQVAGTVTAANGCVVDGIAVGISTTEGHPLPPGKNFDGNGQTTQSFNWVPALSENGRYTVTVEAVQRRSGVIGECGGKASRQVDLWVEMAPAPVALSRIQPDSKKRSVTVVWQRSAESDLVGYLVYRAHEDGAFAPVYGTEQPASGSTVSFFDDLSQEEGGEYRYRVVSLRPSADWYQANRTRPPVASADTAQSGGSATMPPQPKPVTTTTPAGGSGGSSSGSGGSSSGARRGVRSSGGIDFGKFAAELDSLKRDGTEGEPDPGFDERLDYGDRTIIERLGEESAADPVGDEKERPVSLLLFASGLLALAVAGHLVWLRQEVARVDELEAAEPDGALDLAELLGIAPAASPAPAEPDDPLDVPLDSGGSDASDAEPAHEQPSRRRRVPAG